MTLSLSRTMFLGAAFAIAAATFAVPAIAVQEQQQAQSPNMIFNPSVIAFDQKADGKTVELAYAFVSKPSLIAIYEGNSRASPSGEPLAVMKLEPGDHRHIKVHLNAEAKPGTQMWVSLYDDKDADGKLTKSDVSYWKGEPLPTENGFVIR